MKQDKKWYLPDTETFEAKGPYSTDDVNKKLKSKELNIDDFIWSDDQELERWVRIFECSEFKDNLHIYPKCKIPKKRSKGLATQVIKVNFKNEGGGEYGKENNYRRYPRAPIFAKCIVHNQNEFIEGYAVDISEKGVLIEVDNLSVFKVGEEIVLTIIEHTELETFSVSGVVIHEISKDGKNHVGLFFLKIAPQLKRKIAEFVISKLAHEDISRDENIEQTA